LIASVAFLGAVIVLISSLSAIQLSEKAELAERAERDAREKAELAERAERDAREKLWGSYRDQAHASRLSRSQGQRFHTLETLQKAAELARALNLPEERLRELRNEAIASLALPDLRVAREWDGFPGTDCHVDFDGSLERYAALNWRNGVVSVRRAVDGTEIYRLLLGFRGEDAWPTISGDGRFVGVAASPRCKVWRLVGEEPVLVLDDAATVCFAFSPDNRRLALGQADNSIILFDLASGRRLCRLEPSPAPRWLAFHPTKPEPAVGSPDSVHIRNLESGKVVWKVSRPWVQVECVAWHPNGKSLAAVGGDRVIVLWDVATCRPISRLEGHKGGGIHFVFSHRGDLLASGGWEGKLRLWDVRTGKQLFSTPAVTDPLYKLRFSADDRFLAGAIDGRKLRIWEVADGGAYRTLIRHPALGNSTHFSPAIRPDRDGRLLAQGTDDGVEFWDLATGRELGFLHFPRAQYPLFEPSGDLLINGNGGLLLWPIKADAGAAGRLRIGPPQPLPLQGSPFALACSGDGRVLASPQQWGALVLHRDHPGKPVRLAPHDDARYVAVSPDGRWIATGSHGASKQLKVWEADSGRLVRDLPAGGVVCRASVRTAAGWRGWRRPGAAAACGPCPRGSPAWNSLTRAIPLPSPPTASCWPWIRARARSGSSIRPRAGNTPGWRTPTRTAPNVSASARTARNWWPSATTALPLTCGICASSATTWPPWAWTGTCLLIRPLRPQSPRPCRSRSNSDPGLGIPRPLPACLGTPAGVG
jgi:WD40 repeat protein